MRRLTLQARRPLRRSCGTSMPSSMSSSMPASPLFSSRCQLSNDARDTIRSMLRIDQAGEVAAVRIASAQLWWMSPLDAGTPIVQEILGEELVHRTTMHALVAKHHVRPTVLDPAFALGAVAMGLGTAVLGHNAIMCCHAAVEDVISEHYNDQLREIVAMRAQMAGLDAPRSGAAAGHAAADTTAAGSDVSGGPQEVSGVESSTSNPSEPTAQGCADAAPPSDDALLAELQTVVAKFRDDELHHKELGEQNGAAKAPLYPLLYHGIRGACMLGVKLARRF